MPDQHGWDGQDRHGQQVLTAVGAVVICLVGQPLAQHDQQGFKKISCLGGLISRVYKELKKLSTNASNYSINRLAE